MELEDLGFSQEEVLERVVCRIVHGLHEDDAWDSGLESRVGEAVETKIDELFERHVLPKVGEIIETMTLTPTNRWGEPKGERVTFVEYLIQQAENYIGEKVNWDGRSKSEARDGYGWSGQQTRLTHMIHQHLHHHIEQAMKSALRDANAALAKSLEETVKMKLGEIQQSLKLKVDAGR